MYYILLTGAIKNLGDFLIADRTKKLLKHLRPDREIIEKKSWESLDKDLEEINRSVAVIIHGGPGYQPNMYHGVYPLVKNLDDIKVPIIPMALGWKGVPGDELCLKNYKFSPTSIQLLKKIHDNITYSSCRDYLTQRVLAKHGFKNVLMTGCSVWYDIDSLGKEFQAPKQIKKIVYTPAQNDIFGKQSIQLLQEIKNTFPQAEIICSFHRGISEDKFTMKKDAENAKNIIDACQKMGVKHEDVAYDLSRIDFYKECDMHIGYRLHAHLHFLSNKKVSFLVNEDGRGRGAQEALGLLSIEAYQRTILNQFSEKFKLNKVPKVRGVINLLGKKYIPNNDTSEKLISFIQEETANGFERVKNTLSLIDNHYPQMQKFIKSLP